MRLVKEISFDRVKEMSYFDGLKEKFIKTQKNKPNNKIVKTKEFSDLHFFVLIEFEDVFDKIDFFRDFFNKNSVDSNNFKQEHDGFLKHLQRMSKKKKMPECFKKLGGNSHVKGCYLIASVKNAKGNIRPINSSTAICVRFNYNNLPHEINEMCTEFSKYRNQIVMKEKREFNKMISMSMEEQEKLINTLIQDIQFPPPGIFHPVFMLSKHNVFPSSIFNAEIINNKLKIEEAIENHLDDITDVKFLNGLMITGIKQENYELCSKIRDRINKIKKIPLKR